MSKIPVSYNVLMTLALIGMHALSVPLGMDKPNQQLFLARHGVENPFVIALVFLALAPPFTLAGMLLTRSLWNRVIVPITSFKEIDLSHAYALGLVAIAFSPVG